MKSIYLILGVIFTFILLYLILINFEVTSNIDLVSGEVQEVKTGFLILLSGLFGGIIASSVWGYFYQFAKNQKTKHIRAAEKAAIKAEESSDRVKTLEAKIQTLEEALKKALK